MSSRPPEEEVEEEDGLEGLAEEGTPEESRRSMFNTRPVGETAKRNRVGIPSAKRL